MLDAGSGTTDARVDVSILQHVALRARNGRRIAIYLASFPMTRDVALALIGLALSITLFVAQGPYTNAWKYIVGFSPLLATLLTLAAIHLVRRYRALGHALSLAMGTRLSLSSVVRIENRAGDVTMERRRKLSIVSDKTVVSYTPDEGVFVSTKADGLPPTATITASRVASRRLILKTSYDAPVQIRGQQAWQYGWSYRIEPPLHGKGDFVEYVVQLRLPATESEIFEPEGDTFVVENAYYASTTDIALIAPSGYIFQLVDSWLEDFDGNRIELDDRERPRISTNAHELTWKPTWQKGARHICRLRLRSITQSV